MADFFFNELSIHNQFQDDNSFLIFLNYFGACRNSITNQNHKFFIHREISKRVVCGIPLAKAIREKCSPDQKRLFMNWIDRSGIFLPDEQQYRDTDSFYHNNTDISGSALAECAYRRLLDQETSAISYTPSAYPDRYIEVSLKCDQEEHKVILENDRNLQELNGRLTTLLPPLSSWAMLFERAKAIPHIRIMGYVMDRLNSHPFNENLADAILQRIRALGDMMACELGPDGQPSKKFHEQFCKYCTKKGNSWFSDSSSTEKGNKFFKEKLTFSVNEKQVECFYHAKIKMREFRIHMDSIPFPQRTVSIVYIGPKITKR